MPVSRPQPSAEWRVYRCAVDCPSCGNWWLNRPLRFLGGVWWLKCPICDDQQWKAR